MNLLCISEHTYHSTRRSAWASPSALRERLVSSSVGGDDPELIGLFPLYRYRILRYEMSGRRTFVSNTLTCTTLQNLQHHAIELMREGVFGGLMMLVSDTWKVYEGFQVDKENGWHSFDWI